MYTHSLLLGHNTENVLAFTHRHAHSLSQIYIYEAESIALTLSSQYRMDDVCVAGADIVYLPAKWYARILNLISSNIFIALILCSRRHRYVSYSYCARHYFFRLIAFILRQ